MSASFPHITAIYAALLGLMMASLGSLVVRQRFKQQVSLMDNGKLVLREAIRRHGNFSEYVPLALVLIGLVELGGARAWLVHLLGCGLLVARLLHACGIKATRGATFGRVSGILITYTVFVITSLWLLWATIIT